MELTVNNLSKKFNKKEVLSAINASFPSTGVAFIVGINGSGKTTLINIITTLIKPTSGNITLGQYHQGMREYKKELFYIPSDFYIPEYMTGEEYFEFVCNVYHDLLNIDKHYFFFLAELFEIDKAIRKPIETYSYGMKKKLQICIAFTIKTQYLIADEITNGLDFESIELLQKLIEMNKCQRSFILVSHTIDFITKFPDDIRILDNGVLSDFTGEVASLETYLINKGDLHEKFQSLHQYQTHSKVPN